MKAMACVFLVLAGLLGTCVAGSCVSFCESRFPSDASARTNCTQACGFESPKGQDCPQDCIRDGLKESAWVGCVLGCEYQRQCVDCPTKCTEKPNNVFTCNSTTTPLVPPNDNASSGGLIGGMSPTNQWIMFGGFGAVGLIVIAVVVAFARRRSSSHTHKDAYIYDDDVVFSGRSHKDHPLHAALNDGHSHEETTFGTLHQGGGYATVGPFDQQRGGEYASSSDTLYDYATDRIATGSAAPSPQGSLHGRPSVVLYPPEGNAVPAMEFVPPRKVVYASLDLEEQQRKDRRQQQRQQQKQHQHQHQQQGPKDKVQYVTIDHEKTSAIGRALAPRLLEREKIEEFRKREEQQQQQQQRFLLQQQQQQQQQQDQAQQHEQPYSEDTYNGEIPPPVPPRQIYRHMGMTPARASMDSQAGSSTQLLSQDSFLNVVPMTGL